MSTPTHGRTSLQRRWLTSALSTLLSDVHVAQTPGGGLKVTWSTSVSTCTRAFGSVAEFERYGLEEVVGMVRQMLLEHVEAARDGRPQHTTDLGMGKQTELEDVSLEAELSLLDDEVSVGVLTTGAFQLEDLPLDLSDPPDHTQSFRIGERLKQLADENVRSEVWRDDDRLAARHATTRIDPTEIARRMQGHSGGTPTMGHHGRPEHATIVSTDNATTSFDELVAGDLLGATRRALGHYGFLSALVYELADDRVSIKLLDSAPAMIVQRDTLHKNLIGTIDGLIDHARARGVLPDGM